MKIGIFTYSRCGCETARRMMRSLCANEIRAYSVKRLAQAEFAPIPRPSREFYGELFAWADALIFVGACGIAVREIAPHVKSKVSDPAVIDVDELGHFVIPLLSGHIGGANALAAYLAQQIDATPVITTATDIHAKFSVDTWASQNGFAMSSLSAAQKVSASVLEGNVPLHSDFPVVTDYPSGVVPGETGAVGIAITVHTEEPFDETLRLIPSVLHLGIGCRRDTPEETIEEAVSTILAEHHLERRAIRVAASIDLKMNEQGLLRFCERNHWPIRFYPGAVLEEVKGNFTPSAFVKNVTGVDNVCERAAMVGAQKLLVRKTVRNGVTVAVATEELEVSFG